MEVGDVTRRIVGQHWALIACCLVLGLAVAALIRGGGGAMYAASARLVLDTEDPKSQAESSAIADTARAIATSPTQVKAAIAASHAVGRDPTELADKRIAVRALGTSGVLKLTVSDRDPRVAAAIANALARNVLRVRTGVSNGMRQTLEALDKEMASVNRQISNLDAQIQAAGAGGQASQASRTRRDELLRRRSLLTSRRTVLESREVSLLSTAALRPTPTIISSASPPRRREPSGLTARLVLGAILGGVLGVGLAGLRETFRPTLVGGDAVAAELGAPLLGALPIRPGEDPAADDLGPLAARLRLASRKSGVRRVDLLAVGEGADARRLADRLGEALAATEFEAGAERAAPTRAPAEVGAGSLATPEQAALEAPAASRLPPVSVRAFTSEGAAAGNGTPSGVVVVSPATVEKRVLAEARRTVSLTAAPLVGVIACAPPQGPLSVRRRAARRRRADARKPRS